MRDSFELRITSVRNERYNISSLYRFFSVRPKVYEYPLVLIIQGWVHGFAIDLGRVSEDIGKWIANGIHANQTMQGISIDK